MPLGGTYPQCPVPVSSNLLHTRASDVPQATARKAKRELVRAGQSLKCATLTAALRQRQREAQQTVCPQLPCPTGRNMGIEADGGYYVTLPSSADLKMSKSEGSLEVYS